MKIHTVFELGDTVYYIINGGIFKEDILKIRIELSKEEPGAEILYVFHSGLINENNCFDTIEKLVDYWKIIADDKYMPPPF